MFSTLLRHVLLFVLYGCLGLVIGIGSYYVLEMNKRPELAAWHTAWLHEDFHADDAAQVQSLAGYLVLEDKLFAELEQKVYREVEAEQASPLNRYWAGSTVDWRQRQPDWNRTQILMPEGAPRGVALLLHGLSDSPYSLHTLATHLQSGGWKVVVLRLPGHGTAPTGLLDVRWQDWAAAVRLVARDIARDEKQPFLLAGYSNGAALAVEYMLAQQQGEKLPRPSALVLISPAIGVSSAARFAYWQKIFARIPGLQKLAWVDLLPEYDPYKYGSFAVNAGEQIWRLTRRIHEQMTALAGPEGVKGLPPVLAFQSVADATVSAPAVVDSFYQKLAPEAGKELVLFDANRITSTRPLLRPALFAVRDKLLKGMPLPFDLTVVSNASTESSEVAAWRRPRQSATAAPQPLGLRWPAGMFALSHVALPFAPEDALYGATAPEKVDGLPALYLGRIELFGERGLLLVPEASLMRARYNPFFPYLLQRVDNFIAPLQSRVPPSSSS
ncbi:MAG: alpha/beta hydrolase [Moraxellaceae bacterium]